MAKQKATRKGRQRRRFGLVALVTGVAGTIAAGALLLTNVSTIAKFVLPTHPDLQMTIRQCSRKELIVMVKNSGSAPSRLERASLMIVRDATTQSIDTRVADVAGTRDTAIPPTNLPVFITLEPVSGGTPLILPPPFGDVCRVKVTLQFSDATMQNLECACPAE